MTDFLRMITGYLYVVIPILIALFVIYKIVASKLPEQKLLIKKVYTYVTIFVVALFTLAVIRMAAINEVPENELNKSVKSDRSNYAIEKSKQDTITIK